MSIEPLAVVTFEVNLWSACDLSICWIQVYRIQLISVFQISPYINQFSSLWLLYWAIIEFQNFKNWQWLKKIIEGS